MLRGLSDAFTELIPATYRSLREDGLSPQEIRKIIEHNVAISQRRLRELLPPEAKDSSQVRKKEIEDSSRRTPPRKPEPLPQPTGDTPHVCCVHVKEKEQKIKELEEDLRYYKGTERKYVRTYGHPSP